ncbi:MAG: hypothetical protein M1832_003254 [Thelocarpon impressellum]|nr:MAG: hypothetical protein M1832_003254 [Thelocarpon impressellum]
MADEKVALLLAQTGGRDKADDTTRRASADRGPSEKQPEEYASDTTDEPVVSKSKEEEANGRPDEKDGEKTAKEDDKGKSKDTKKDDKPPPAGGYDDTPAPRAAPGYTVRFTFHRATELPMADINSLSSDPYIVAELKTDLPKRQAEDPPFLFRSPTKRRTTNPVWDCPWIVGHVPSSGFNLKVRIYDEDPADHDDRLGNVRIVVPSLGEDWHGIHEQAFKIKKRMGSKRAYLIRGCTALFTRGMHMSGHLHVSVQVLGRTEGPGGRIYNIGPQYWSQHLSPMIGRITGTKEPGDDNKTEKYNFQANQFQLRGPVPPHLYHRYVEFKPFVKGMFTRSGVRGRILNLALHHQHAHVYNYDRSTLYGSFPEPSREMTLQFLSMVHFDQGGRVFTYVLTLNGQFRFTETGKEFGIDLLSKHTMHSDVSIYVAFSGEFLVRRLRYPEREPGDADQKTHPPAEIEGGPPQEEPSRDPSCYELIIDNDSGTYRPNGLYLEQLKGFMEDNLPGLKIQALACDDERLAKMKEEQKASKDAEGDRRTFLQTSDAGSISSSDESELERRAGGSERKKRKMQMKRRIKRSKITNLGGEGSKFERGVRIVAEPRRVVESWRKGNKGKRDGEAGEKGRAH